MHLPLRVTSIQIFRETLMYLKAMIGLLWKFLMPLEMVSCLASLHGDLWIALLGLLMVFIAFTMDAGVGVFIGIPFLRGSIDAPKLYARLHLSLSLRRWPEIKFQFLYVHNIIQMIWQIAAS
jgi:hypothetical protein